MFNVKETDTLFDDSPDTGLPECKCSRCGNKIKTREIPLRCWPTDEHGNVLNYEYRYCENCMKESGISMWADKGDDYDDGLFDDENFQSNYD